MQSGDNGRRVNFYIRDEFSSLAVDFSAPEGQQLLAGYYRAARRYPFMPLNGLSVSGFSRGCNRLTGRFVVLEVAIAPNGIVDRFAADFEQHCEDAVPALVGSIRYYATVDDVVPFGGAYPSYQLTVVPPAHGRVAGGGGRLRQRRLALPRVAARRGAGHAYCNAGPGLRVHGMGGRLPG